MLNLKSLPKQKLSSASLMNQQQFCRDVKKNPSKYRSNVRFACNNIIKPVVKKKKEKLNLRSMSRVPSLSSVSSQERAKDRHPSPNRLIENLQ